MTKFCASCNQNKPICDFYPNKARKDKLDVYCKECHKIQIKARREKLKNRTEIAIPEFKPCHACNMSQSNAEFHKNSCNPDGLEHRCKTCTGKRFRTEISIKKEEEAQVELDTGDWKPISSTQGFYWASKDGRICSAERISTRSNNRPHTTKPRILELNKNEKGYLHFRYYNPGNPRKTISVHRAVYEAWNGSIPENMDIDHIDSNPANNHIDNLQAVNRDEHSKLTKKRNQDKFYNSGYKQGYNEGFTAGFEAGKNSVNKL